MHWSLVTVLIVLAIRAWYLFARYAAGSGVQRFHVESATALFVAIGIALVAFSARRFSSRREVRAAERTRVSSWLLCGVFCVLALALYWPALHIGLLSDDYVLAERAAQWDLSRFNPQGFRPIPLLLWALALHARAGAIGLHALNLLLHGTNAFLTVRVVEGLMPNRIASTMAGAIVLVSPIALEAVVWSSGIFDVACTTVALGAVLIARRYDEPGVWRRAGFYFVCILAVLCKEAAVIVPLVVIVDAWIRRAVSRRLLVDTIALTCAFAAYGALRVSAAPAGIATPITRFMLQRYVFGMFGAFAAPWHIDVMHRHPSLPIAYAAIVFAMATAFVIRLRDAHAVRTAAGAAIWMLIAALPAMTFIAVAPDLQGSRFLYFATIGWALLLVTLATPAGERPGLSPHGMILAILVVFAAAGVRMHLVHWEHAAAHRDRIEESARANLQMMECRDVEIEGLPDSEQGAYIFRNGAEIAFARDVGIQATIGVRSPGRCSFQWANGAFLPKPTTRD